MQVPDSVVQAVRAVLNTKARSGKTTKKEATILVIKRIENAGGPTRFGIGAATMRVALNYLIDGEVSRQLKMGLTDHEQMFMMPASTPKEIIAALGKVPRWIAVGEGADAPWKFSLAATAEDWLKNANMKEKKAQQTQAKANASLDIARFLAMNKFGCLSEAIAKGT